MPEPFVFRWEPDTARYRDLATGRFVAQDTILDWCQQSIDASENVTDMLAQYVSDGTVSPGDWERLMRQEIKKQYITEYIAGRGGREQMTARDWGSTGGMLKREFQYLRDFTTEIASGELSEAQIRARAAMYVRGSNEAYDRAATKVAGIAGMTEEKWVVDPEKESCPDCLAFQAEGWKPIGYFPPVASGATQCLSNCGCHKEFRATEAA